MAVSYTLLPPTWRGNFPHMAEGDRDIWLRWLDQEGAKWQGFAYDVAVGGQEAPAEVTDPKIRAAWRFNTAKRIDALGAKPGQLCIFEVRSTAGVSAIGALQAYEALFKEEDTSGLPVSKCLVTDFIAPDTRRAAEAQGITVTMLPPP